MAINGLGLLPSLSVPLYDVHSGAQLSQSLGARLLLDTVLVPYAGALGKRTAAPSCGGSGRRSEEGFRRSLVGLKAQACRLHASW